MEILIQNHAPKTDSNHFLSLPVKVTTAFLRKQFAVMKDKLLMIMEIVEKTETVGVTIQGVLVLYRQVEKTGVPVIRQWKTVPVS